MYIVRSASGRDHDQAAPGFDFMEVATGPDIVFAEFAQVEIAGFVVGNLAGEKGLAAEIADRVERVGDGTAAHHLALAASFAQGGDYFFLAFVTDQGHHPAPHAMGGKEVLFDLVFDIHQRIARAVHVDLSHGSGHARILAKAFSAAARVSSISRSPWAAEMNPASKAEGARYTPLSSMPWKKVRKRLILQSMTCSKASISVSSLKKSPNMAPAWLVVKGTEAAAARLCSSLSMV